MSKTCKSEIGIVAQGSVATFEVRRDYITVNYHKLQLSTY